MKVYLSLWSIGLFLLSFWNLNHSFRWFESMDRAYGTGVALLILGGSYFAFISAEDRIKKIICGLFLYLSLSNLMDELFFNPLIVNYWEYLTGLLMLIPITKYVDRIKKNRA